MLHGQVLRISGKHAQLLWKNAQMPKVQMPKVQMPKVL
jgi:hypothetical protein